MLKSLFFDIQKLQKNNQCLWPGEELVMWGLFLLVDIIFDDGPSAG